MPYWVIHFIDRFVGIPMVMSLSVLKRSKSRIEIHRRNHRLENILLIKFTMMGDTILLIPAIRALKKRYPSAKITFLCSNVNEAILQRCPYIDELVSISITEMFNPIKMVNLMATLRKTTFGIVLDFEQWFRVSVIIAFFLHSHHMIGFETDGQHRHYLFDEAVKHENSKHEVACYFDMLSKLSIEKKAAPLELWLNERDRTNAEQKMAYLGISKNDPFIVIHPGSSHWPQKQWPEASYVDLCNELVRRFDIKIVLTGSGDEKYLVKRIQTGAKPTNRVVSSVGQLALFELAAVLKQAKCFISGNTGVMHLACAVQTPTILLNGPVSSDKWGPWWDKAITINSTANCAPCVYLGFEYGCRDNKCMQTISVNDVISVMEKSHLV